MQREMPWRANPHFCDGQHSLHGGFTYPSYDRTMVTGRLTMLGIEFIGYGCLLLAFTAVQYACLLTSALKA
jgi:hypothetical protein